jgi:methyl-accepting chemotaxis protein
MTQEIAYQTNLLALNAAIGSARAGGHGKGFAIMASELGKLVGQNAVLADSAGPLLDEMLPGLQETWKLVREISEAQARLPNELMNFLKTRQ